VGQAGNDGRTKSTTSEEVREGKVRGMLGSCGDGYEASEIDLNIVRGSVGYVQCEAGESNAVEGELQRVLWCLF